MYDWTWAEGARVSIFYFQLSNNRCQARLGLGYETGVNYYRLQSCGIIHLLPFSTMLPLSNGYDVRLLCKTTVPQRIWRLGVRVPSGVFYFGSCVRYSHRLQLPDENSTDTLMGSERLAVQ